MLLRDFLVSGILGKEGLNKLNPIMEVINGIAIKTITSSSQPKHPPHLLVYQRQCRLRRHLQHLQPHLLVHHRQSCLQTVQLPSIPKQEMICVLTRAPTSTLGSARLTTTTDSPCFDWCDQNDHSRVVGVAVRNSSDGMKRCYCLFSIAIPTSLRWDKYAYNAARDQVREHPGNGEVQGADGAADVVCYKR
ncbi:hypothetical protein ACHAWO_004365 [Cyclotella atomus]|uniref:Uncharacterized protein n=1 Tax=Cyclotella atomus TaxID=382360 RepID=A0ABD3MXG0_9STRA